MLPSLARTILEQMSALTDITAQIFMDSLWTRSSRQQRQRRRWQYFPANEQDTHDIDDDDIRTRGNCVLPILTTMYSFGCSTTVAGNYIWFPVHNICVCSTLFLSLSCNVSGKDPSPPFPVQSARLSLQPFSTASSVQRMPIDPRVQTLLPQKYRTQEFIALLGAPSANKCAASTTYMLPGGHVRWLVNIIVVCSVFVIYSVVVSPWMCCVAMRTSVYFIYFR